MLPKRSPSRSASKRSKVAEAETPNENQEETKLPQKRAPTEEETRIDLGDNRFIMVSTYRGRQYIDTREFFHDESGELRPSKKGFALKPDEWKKLLAAKDKINANLRAKIKSEEETKIELWENRFATVSMYKGRQYVNMREFYTDESGKLRPSNKGIALNPDMWKKLLGAADSINENLMASQESFLLDYTRLE